MRLKSYAIAALTASILIVPAVSAHVIEGDGSIAILLHLEPNDDPIIGKAAVAKFTVSDSSNEFAFEKCDCMFSVTHTEQDGRPEVTPAAFLIENKGRLASFSYVFKEGDYVLTLAAVPKPGAKFNPFTTVFNVQITNDGSTFAPPHIHEGHYLHTAVILAVFAVFFILHIRDRIRNKKETTGV
jgi:hypothetical protein